MYSPSALRDPAATGWDRAHLSDSDIFVGRAILPAAGFQPALAA
jgi:hypothetical protein